VKIVQGDGLLIRRSGPLEARCPATHRGGLNRVQAPLQLRRHFLEVRMNVGFGFGMMVAVVLIAALLVPYLLKEIRGGKVETNPRIPTGAGDTHPGRRGNPAPGKPDGQADPYDEEARR
jgi:hypothetical protein